MDGWIDRWIDEWMNGWMVGWMVGWMDGWILTVDSFPIRGPDLGTPPAGQGGHYAAHTYAPDPTSVRF